jgi:amino acid adenylation domain-containing protein
VKPDLSQPLPGNLQPGILRKSAAVHDLLVAAVEEHPNSVAVRDGEGEWTTQQLVTESRRVSRWLRECGVCHGDRVAVSAVPDRRFLALLYGTLMAGAVLVPLSPTLKQFHLAHILADADPALVIADERWPRAAGPVRSIAYRDAWALIAAMPEDDKPQCTVDLAFLIYTSGSTGMPKAVACPHDAVVFATRAISERLCYRPDDIVFSRLPFSFDYGLYQILLATHSGAGLYVAGPGIDIGLLQAVRDSESTVLPLVPSLASILVGLARRDSRPTSLRLFTNTGEALPAPLIAELRHRFPGTGLHLMYGTTECKRITIMEVDGDLTRPSSVGRALAGTEVSVVDDAGMPLPPQETGEVVVTGPNVMAGYWRAPELTDRVFRRDSRTGQVRLFTGDWAHFDHDGYLYFEGRRDDIFKLRGVRTSAAEIEAAALDIPGITEAAVMPPTETAVAVLHVVLAPGVTAGSVEILRQLGDRLDLLKVPDVCRIVTELARNEHGKVDRTALTQMSEGSHDGQ